MNEDNIEQSDDILSRLRGISSEEKTELGKLKCRIDDQSRLIMMLKKRNDEYLIQNIQLDKHCQQLEQQIDLLKEQIEEQSTKDRRIDELRSIVEQMKSSKEIFIDKEVQWQQQILFYRSQYEQLQDNQNNLHRSMALIESQLKDEQQRSIHLADQFQQDILLKNQHIEHQQQQIERLNRQIIDLENDLEEKLRQIESNRIGFDEEMIRCRSNETILQNQIRNLDKSLQMAKDKEKSFLNDLIEKEKKIDEWKHRFEIEEEKINLNCRVKSLEENVRIKDEQIHQIQQEFNAYRSYTTTLLNKEKQINERLQNLLNGKSQ